MAGLAECLMAVWAGLEARSTVRHGQNFDALLLSLFGAVIVASIRGLTSYVYISPLWGKIHKKFPFTEATKHKLFIELIFYFYKFHCVRKGIIYILRTKIFFYF